MATYEVNVNQYSNNFIGAFNLSASFTLRSISLDFDGSASPLGVHPVILTRYLTGTVTAPSGGGGGALNLSCYDDEANLPAFTGYTSGTSAPPGLTGPTGGQVFNLGVWKPALEGRRDFNFSNEGISVPSGGAIFLQATGDTNATGGTHVSPAYLCNARLILEGVK